MPNGTSNYHLPCRCRRPRSCRAHIAHWELVLRIIACLGIDACILLYPSHAITRACVTRQRGGTGQTSMTSTGPTFLPPSVLTTLITCCYVFKGVSDIPSSHVSSSTSSSIIPASSLVSVLADMNPLHLHCSLFTVA